MEKEIIMLIIFACLAVAFIVLFVMQIRTYDKHLKEITISTLNVAAAGSAHPNTPEKIKVENLFSQKFCDKAGTPVDFNGYLKFWIKGWSMLLSGIKNDDILFAKPIPEAEIEHLSFDTPKVLVLKRDGKSRTQAIEKDDYAKYKVRRTWAILPFDEELITAKVDEIMRSDTFQQLQKDYPENFFSDEDMKTFFAKRIANYKREYSSCEKTSSKDNAIILSTSLRRIEGEKDRKVIFSIHPARTIVAQAIHSFHKKGTQKV